MLQAQELSLSKNNALTFNFLNHSTGCPKTFSVLFCLISDKVLRMSPYWLFRICSQNQREAGKLLHKRSTVINNKLKVEQNKQPGNKKYSSTNRLHASIKRKYILREKKILSEILLQHILGQKERKFISQFCSSISELLLCSYITVVRINFWIARHAKHIAITDPFKGFGS